MDDREEDRREKVRWVLLLSCVALAFYLCWLMLRPFVGVLLWALVLTTAFEPIHERILRRVKSPDGSALLSCLVVIIVTGVPTVLIGLALVHELAPAINTLQNMLVSLFDPESPVIGNIARWLAERGVDVGSLKQQAIDQVQAMGKELANQAPGYVRGIVGGAMGFVIQLLFVLFTMYYLFRDGKKFRNALAGALPLRGRTTNRIFHRTREVISASVYGVFVIAIIQGLLGALAFWVLGLPSVVVWGLVMVFFSLIPMAGAFVVWVPAAIYLAVSGQYGAAIGLTVWGTVVIGLVDNFLRPKLVGERAKLHELFIFFAVLGGLQVFGLVGIFLGPVVLAIALALFDAFRHPETMIFTSVGAPAAVPIDSTLPGVVLTDATGKPR